MAAASTRGLNVIECYVSIDPLSRRPQSRLEHEHAQAPKPEQDHHHLLRELRLPWLPVHIRYWIIQRDDDQERICTNHMDKNEIRGSWTTFP